MKVIILYEIISREYQNACLIKAELEKRGHEVYIYKHEYVYVHIHRFGFIPDVLVTPYLYADIQLNVFKDMFNDKLPRIVNLQYEQIFSKYEIINKCQIPDGLKKNAIHICWSKRWKDVLYQNYIKDTNLVLAGSLTVDMCRERFKNIYRDRVYISENYGLNPNKKWILFVSSFTLPDANDFKINWHYKSKDWGKKKTDERINIDTKSRNEILNWIEKYIKENECEFIYRPHPSEHINKRLINLENIYSNFNIIKDDSIRLWIKNCDKIHTWYSTSIIEVYFMGKVCSILRPFKLPESMHSELLDSGKFTKTYEEFCKFNNSNIIEFPIDENLILNDFYINKKKYAYEIICDLLEDIVNKNVIMNLY